VLTAREDPRSSTTRCLQVGNAARRQPQPPPPPPPLPLPPLLLPPRQDLRHACVPCSAPFHALGPACLPACLTRVHVCDAVVSHHGKLPVGGHYTCDVLHTHGRWLHFDDKAVSIVSAQAVRHTVAPLLRFFLW
jgi:hypothetical protein